MKKLIIPIACVVLMTGFPACKKDASSSQTNLVASKQSSIAKGEPVQFSLSQAPANASVAWTVSPSANTQVNASGNKATILFGEKGSYTINAVAAGISANSSVTVGDSVYNPGGTGTGSNQPTTASLLANELIKITVSRIDSVNTSGLVFSAQTSNSYPCDYNTLIAQSSITNSAYSFNFSGVSIPAGCSTGTSKAGAYVYAYPITAGTIPLSITVAGKTYTGSITKSGNNYSIGWTNTTAVTITPTSL